MRTRLGVLSRPAFVGVGLSLILLLATTETCCTRKGVKPKGQTEIKTPDLLLELRYETWQRIPGRIVGGMPYKDHGTFSFYAMDEFERMLQREIAGKASSYEVFALVGYSRWGAQASYVIRLTATGATITTYKRTKPEQTLVLEKADLDFFLNRVKAFRLDDLVCYDTGWGSGVQFEYLHLTKDFGRRVYMNNPEAEPDPNNPDVNNPGAPYCMIVKIFEVLSVEKPSVK